MERIKDVYIREYITPTYKPFKVTYGEHKYIEHLIIKVRSENFTGYGDVTPLTFFTGETVQISKKVLEDFIPRLKGVTIDEAINLTKRLSFYPSTRAGIEMALLDIKAKEMGVPLYEVLGTKVRGEVKVSTAIGSEDIESSVKEAIRLKEQGYRCFKVKVIEDPEREAKKVKMIREAIGDDIVLRLDANGAYNAKAAIKLSKLIEGEGIQYFEQPVPREDIEGLREVKRATTIPIMADESALNSRDVLNLIKRNAVDLIAIKLAKCGSIYEAKRIAEFSETASISCVVISAFDTAIGISANIQLIASTENFPYPNDLALWSIVDDKSYSILMKTNSTITVTEEKGIGIIGGKAEEIFWK